MTEQPERPSTLKRTPRPAHDELTDPVDVAAVPTTAPEPPVTQPVRRTREAKAPLSTLVSLDVMDIIERVSSEKGLTKRAVVEQAIRQHWGPR